MSPKNVPPLHVDYFDLKATETREIQEKLFASPLTA